MKQFILFFLLLPGFSSFGQLSVTVTGAKELCSGMSITLEAEVITTDTLPISYQWLKNGALITDSIRAYLMLNNVTFSDSGYYQCIVTNGLLTDTSDAVHIPMFAALTIDTLYRFNDLGCPGVCKGQYLTHISGGNPLYTYDWGGGKTQVSDPHYDTLRIGLCPGYHTLTVRDHDSSHCITRKYFVDVLKLPKIKITKDPKDTVYLTHPTLTVSFPDSSKKYLTNWQWQFGDSAKVSNIDPATHAYSKTGHFKITLGFTDQNGCDTTIYDTILVKYVDLIIPGVFTPNGDGFNDTFEIKEKGGSNSSGGFKSIDLLEVYESDQLVVFDRWGKKVYEKTNYRSGDWNGGNLSDGVYYYLFKGKGPYNEEVYKGSVTILRGH
jgi:gliding motility-associated-like protein